MLDVQTALETFHVAREEAVDKAEQLHDAFVLSEILMAFEEVVIIASVATFEC